METEEIIDAIHEHLDQAFDKVSVVPHDRFYSLTVTVSKGGRIALQEIDEDYFDSEDDEDIYDPEAYRERIDKILDNLKYELLKNL